MRLFSRVSAPAVWSGLPFLLLAAGCSPRLAGGGKTATGLPRLQDTVSAQVPRQPAAASSADTTWTMKTAVTGGEIRCKNGTAKVFACQDADLLAFLPLSAIGGGALSGIWGWTDSVTRREFAIVGRTSGTAFVEVTNPVSPKYLGNLPLREGAQPSSWRDMKVYREHAFIVTEGGGGMQVFDLTQLRNVPDSPVTFKEAAHYSGFGRAHTIAVDAESGFAYPVGAGGGGETCGGGLHMIDIRTPLAPKFAGCYAETLGNSKKSGYIHETQCVVYRGPDQQHRGREICLNAALNAVGVVDVTDKTQPRAISIATYPTAGYTHQGWFTKDQRYFFLNDEFDEMVMAGKVGKDSVRTRTIVFDMNDLDDPVVLTEFYGTTAATDHNLYIRGRYMYQSNYQAGLRIIDIGDPKNPKEVGYFDTFPSANATGYSTAVGFSGAWSNYPYFTNGVVAVTNVAEGLFIIRHRSASRTR